MKKPEVLLSGSFNPWFNLATEEWIFTDMDADTQVLFLWRNNDTVVIGRNQNPWKECNLPEMEKDSIFLARRESGGGAVFHDRGNTNFTFLSGIKSYSIEKNFRIITDALSSLGIEAEVSGRNDITSSGKKISGSAFKITSDRAFHHGTLLINANLDRLSQYLSPSILKLKSKGIESARSRVANISEFVISADHEAVSSAIIKSFFSTYGSGETRVLDTDNLKTIESLNRYYEKMKSREWLYGAAPDFGMTLENRFEWGAVEVNINTENGKISEARIFTDSLIADLPDVIEPALKGIPFDRKSVTEALLLAADNCPINASQCAGDIAKWLGSIL